jgi:putative transcriptional regulator
LRGCQGTLTFVRNRVREQRAQRGLSQAETAAALGVSRQTVIAIESGRYSPSLPLAFRIARFFDSTVDAMFDASDEEVPT